MNKHCLNLMPLSAPWDEMVLHKYRSDPATLHIYFICILHFFQIYMATKPAGLFVRENKYHQLATIYYLLLITKTEGLPMEELIEFLKELMKSQAAAKGNVFFSKFNILFHKVPNIKCSYTISSLHLYFWDTVTCKNSHAVKIGPIFLSRAIWKPSKCRIWFAWICERANEGWKFMWGLCDVTHING